MKTSLIGLCGAALVLCVIGLVLLKVYCFNPAIDCVETRVDLERNGFRLVTKTYAQTRRFMGMEQYTICIQNLATGAEMPLWTTPEIFQEKSTKPEVVEVDQGRVTYANRLGRCEITVPTTKLELKDRDNGGWWAGGPRKP